MYQVVVILHILKYDLFSTQQLQQNRLNDLDANLDLDTSVFMRLMTSGKMTVEIMRLITRTLNDEWFKEQQWWCTRLHLVI